MKPSFQCKLICFILLPLVGYQYVVDATQFDIDLETEIGEGLRGGFNHILHLNALSGHSQKSVSNTFYFS